MAVNVEVLGSKISALAVTTSQPYPQSVFTCLPTQPPAMRMVLAVVGVALASDLGVLIFVSVFHEYAYLYFFDLVEAAGAGVDVVAVDGDTASAVTKSIESVFIVLFCWSWGYDS